MRIALIALGLSLAWFADTLPANSSGGCDQNAAPAVAFEFSHTCASDTQCNGTKCLATPVNTDGACDPGTSVPTCTATCTTDSDCQEYNAAKCTLCAPDGGVRVCIPH